MNYLKKVVEITGRDIMFRTFKGPKSKTFSIYSMNMKSIIVILCEVSDIVSEKINIKCALNGAMEI